MQDFTRPESSLGNRIKALEIKNAGGVKAPSATNNQPSPEIQQAMENWLSYNIKGQGDQFKVFRDISWVWHHCSQGGVGHSLGPRELLPSLSHPVKITHVTVDHISRYISPTGSIKSVPKAFELYNPTDDIYRGVEMYFLSNWGQAEYTCLYRFRVHGKIAST
ncbi:unnamed protein product [Pleuronectes platessa]|uniref:SUN domain-containing protein n=1 Tax=Pleuronectes platessa TaxID=8262 RepID=A0A9N7TPA4_PLEPL|nr:unnamed protein product [Pleuronectes platessa]